MPAHNLAWSLSSIVDMCTASFVACLRECHLKCSFWYVKINEVVCWGNWVDVICRKDIPSLAGPQSSLKWHLLWPSETLGLGGWSSPHCSPNISYNFVLEESWMPLLWSDAALQDKYPVRASWCFRESGDAQCMCLDCSQSSFMVICRWHKEWMQMAFQLISSQVSHTSSSSKSTLGQSLYLHCGFDNNIFVRLVENLCASALIAWDVMNSRSRACCPLICSLQSQFLGVKWVRLT